MQVTQTGADGLKREFQVIFPAAELAEKISSQIADIRQKAHIKGFRPGKAPESYIRRVYGRNVVGDVLQEAFSEANQKIISEHNLRPAGQPHLDIVGGQEALEKIIEKSGDLTLTIALETLPVIDVGVFDDVEVERIKVDIPESDIDEGMRRLAEQNTPYADRDGEAPAAEKGDKATIDFIGKIDGEPFDNGAGEDVDLVLGSNSFIPGFEDQLVGVKKGEQREIFVKFPEDYSHKALAGKPATFDVTLKNIAAPGALTLDDEFAKSFGFETLEAYRDALSKRLKETFDRAAFAHTKRSLLDALDKKYSFELPKGLVEQEFNAIWSMFENERKNAGAAAEKEEKSDEELRADYHKIAERRVRLGLLLAEIGDKASVKVEDQEVTRALVERIRDFPGQETAIWDHYRKNPAALEEIRAPIFEDKVIEHILGLAKVTDRHVTKEELEKLSQEEEA